MVLKSDILSLLKMGSTWVLKGLKIVIIALRYLQSVSNALSTYLYLYIVVLININENVYNSFHGSTFDPSVSNRE